jgi:hemolysin activation/secretion protein
LFLLAFSLNAQAQVAPDAGQSIRSIEQQPLQLPPEHTLDLQFPAEEVSQPAPAGGPAIDVRGFSISGNVVFPTDTLLPLLNEFTGQRLSLGDLQVAAARLSRHYREQGYPLARAYVPAQTIDNGMVNIVVLEGRYGNIEVRNEAGLRPFALAPLDALQEGDAVQAAALERALLLMNERNGVTAGGALRPGSAVGTTSLLVNLAATPRVAGRVEYDNGGNRFTGAHRLNASLGVNSPLSLGDRLDLQVLGSDEEQGYYRAAYQIPLGRWGASVGVGYSYMDYDLGADFKELKAYGTSKTAHVFINQSIIASRKFWLSARLQYEHKRLKDKIKLVDIDKDKRSKVTSLSIEGNARDDLFGGGITSFNLAWRHGKLDLLEPYERWSDNLTAKTHGSFNIVAPSLVRLQRLTDDFSLFLRLRGQWTDGNLDGSEKLGLGGAYGVRAYPQGEAQGDEGYVANLELRYALTPGWQLSAFYDHGHLSRINDKKWDDSANSRTLKGGGIGASYASGSWRFDLSAAWKIGHERAQSDTRHQVPRAWVSAAYVF